MTPGLKGIKTIRDFEFTGKVVFLRLDLNVPIKDGQVTDTTRIDGALPTIQFLLEKKAKLILASHLGRPKKAGDKKYSLEPVAEKLMAVLNKEVTLIEDPESDAPKLLLPALPPNQILLLENLRYSPDEEKNGNSLAKKIASYSDIYINDAFGACHRAHSSIVAVPELMKLKGIGFLVEKEITMLDNIMTLTDKPFTAILGGAKVSDKIGVLDHLIDRVDTFIIGGAMAYTFLASQDIQVGKSLVEKEKLSFAKDFLERCRVRDKRVLLPIDHVTATDLENFKNIKTSDKIDVNTYGLDIGPKTIQLFSEAISQSKVLFWNGPMGMFEKKEFEKGTFEVAKHFAANKGFTLVGGGDSAAAIAASGYADKVSHISTGGGASLEYLQGDKLPGLEILREKQQ